MSGDKNSSPDDRRSMLADYLGVELDSRMRAEFEQAMHNDPELAAEVASLQSALHDLRSLDEGEHSSRVTRDHEQNVTNSRPWGHTLRYAAMIGLALVVGYVLRGMEAQPPMDGGTGDSPQVEVQTDSQEDFGTRLARNYLDQPGRSGFGRSLIAYVRTAQRAKKKK